MTTSNVGRPRVICHMATSIDGRIVVEGWPTAASAAVRRQYEQVHASYEADAWLCGRVTMEPFAGGMRSDAEIAREHPGAPREDFIAPGDHESYAFAMDASGRLAWSTNDIGGDHVVAILSNRVSDEYLDSLRGQGVSYLLAGDREVDLALALKKISDRFGVRTLMLEGGGRINAGFLQAGLIDEVSLLIAPIADSRAGTPALFDLDEAGPDAPRSLVLESIERRENNVVWLRYRCEGP